MTRSSSTPSSTGNSQVTRSTTSTRSGGATTRGTTGSSMDNGGKPDKNNSGTSTVTRRSDSGTHVSTGTNSSNIDRTTSRPAADISGYNRGSKPDKGGNGGKPNGGGKPDNGGKPGNGHGHGNGNGHGGNGNGHGNGHGHGGNHGYGGNHNHFDYTGHHYANDFHRNYTNHSWSWSRPLPPPHRPYRLAPLAWYRPVIPVGWVPYTGAPIIDRILGISFGTLFDASLDYLYYNGYEIDGYADHIIYLRDVRLLNHYWDDAMLCYDSYNRLVNAQFVFQTSYYDRNRYDRVYNSLCRVYGYPFTNDDGTFSWYGGNRTGWVTLAIHENLGYCYTTLSIGY